MPSLPAEVTRLDGGIACRGKFLAWSGDKTFTWSPEGGWAPPGVSPRPIARAVLTAQGVAVVTSYGVMLGFWAENAGTWEWWPQKEIEAGIPEMSAADDTVAIYGTAEASAAFYEIAPGRFSRLGTAHLHSEGWLRTVVVEGNGFAYMIGKSRYYAARRLYSWEPALLGETQKPLAFQVVHSFRIGMYVYFEQSTLPKSLVPPVTRLRLGNMVVEETGLTTLPGCRALWKSYDNRDASTAAIILGAYAAVDWSQHGNPVGYDLLLDGGVCHLLTSAGVIEPGDDPGEERFPKEVAAWREHFGLTGPSET